MKILKTKYYHIKGTPTVDGIGLGSSVENYIKAECYYDEGGYSMFTYKQVPRAYYMSAYKLGRGKDSCGTWESHSLFADGCKLKLKEVKRQGKKAAEESLSYFDEQIDDFIARAFPALEVEVEEIILT